MSHAPLLLRVTQGRSDVVRFHSIGVAREKKSDLVLLGINKRILVIDS